MSSQSLRISHDFIFLFFHYPEIVSVNLQNQHLKASFNEGKLFIWGSYELVMFYHKLGFSRMECHEKKAQREFGLILSLPDNKKKSEWEQLLDRLFLDASFYINFLSPANFLSSWTKRLKILPLKIIVTVKGQIIARKEPPENEELSSDEHSLFCGDAHGEEQEKVNKEKEPRLESQYYQTYSLFYEALLKQAGRERHSAEKPGQSGVVFRNKQKN